MRAVDDRSRTLPGPLTRPPSPHRQTTEPQPRAHPSQPRTKPVFVDQTGLRRRWVVIAGSAAGTVLFVLLALLVAGLSGASPVPLPGFPDSVRQVDGHDRPGEPGSTIPTQDPAAPAGTSDPGAPGAGATADTTRRVPTHTPAHPPKPTKST